MQNTVRILADVLVLIRFGSCFRRLTQSCKSLISSRTPLKIFTNFFLHQIADKINAQ